MIFTETQLDGAFVIEPEAVNDRRGFFARVFCEREFAAHGLNPSLVQCNISFNQDRGTLRGMHYQIAPNEEVKIVRCTMGAVYDVIIDLRSRSATYLQWLGVELTSVNHRMLYVPEGFAHGYLTLTANAEVFYQVSAFYAPDSERGVRWDDPAFKIEWPSRPQVVSDKDAHHPAFQP
jgi:dTDP-4-dehydrorhamnose 3,5-epimerase